MDLSQLEEIQRRRAGREWSYLEFLPVSSLCVAALSLRSAAGE